MSFVPEEPLPKSPFNDNRIYFYDVKVSLYIEAQILKSRGNYQEQDLLPLAHQQKTYTNAYIKK